MTATAACLKFKYVWALFSLDGRDGAPQHQKVEAKSLLISTGPRVKLSASISQLAMGDLVIEIAAIGNYRVHKNGYNRRTSLEIKSPEFVHFHSPGFHWPHWRVVHHCFSGNEWSLTFLRKFTNIHC